MEAEGGGYNNWEVWEDSREGVGEPCILNFLGRGERWGEEGFNGRMGEGEPREEI